MQFIDLSDIVWLNMPDLVENYGELVIGVDTMLVKEIIDTITYKTNKRVKVKTQDGSFFVDFENAEMSFCKTASALLTFTFTDYEDAE